MHFVKPATVDAGSIFSINEKAVKTPPPKPTKQNHIQSPTKPAPRKNNDTSSTDKVYIDKLEKKKSNMNTVLISLIAIWLCLCTTLVIRQTQLNLIFFSFISFFGISSILERFFFLGLRPHDIASGVQHISHVQNITKYYVGIAAAIFSFSQLVCISSRGLDDEGNNATESSFAIFAVDESGAVVGDGEYEFRCMAILAGYLAFDLWYTHINNCRPIRLNLVIENAIMLTALSVVLTKVDASHFPLHRPRIVALLTYKLARIVLGLLLLHPSLVNENSSSYRGMMKSESRDDLSGPHNGDGSSYYDDDNDDDKGDNNVEIKKVIPVTKKHILLNDTASRIPEDHPLQKKYPLKIEHKPLKVQEQAFSTERSANKNNGLWTIHGLSYDLSDFVNVHPGGVESILLGRGRDCTALFESYHPFTENHRLILSKYKPVSPPHILKEMAIEGSNYRKKLDTQRDPFYETLKERVYYVLKHEHNLDPIRDRSATVQRAMYYLVVLVGLIWSGYMHVKRSLLGSSLFALFGWLLGALGHDGGHFTVSRNPRINDISVWGMSLLCNPIMWQVQHTFAHHSHTNDFDHDPDLHHFEVFLRVHRRFKADPGYYGKQRMIPYVVFAYMFVVFGECLKIPVSFLMDKSLYNVVEWTDSDRIVKYMAAVVHLLCYIGIVIVGPFVFADDNGEAGWLWTLKGIAAPVLHISLAGLFFAFFSQINHLNEGSMMSEEDNVESNKYDKVPATDEKKRVLTSENTIRRDVTCQDGPPKSMAIVKTSWAAVQVETSNNFASGSAFWHFLSNGLNHQIEHHLFPGLNHCHLSLIAPTVQKTCEEYGVKYECYNTWGDIMKATLQWLDKLSGDV